MSTTDKTFTDEGLKDLKYASVELSLKKNLSVTTVGLFLAIRPLVNSDTPLIDNEEKFVWLVKGDHVHMLSTKHYKIGGVEVGIGKDTKTTKITVFDQERSVKNLEAIMSAMRAQSRVDEHGLINTDTYSDIPGALKKLIGSESTLTEIVRKPIEETSTAPTHRTVNVGYAPVVKKKVVSTTIIKRTTKYPISPAIEKMKAKVQAIREDKYEPPTLPELESDKEEAKKKQE